MFHSCTIANSFINVYLQLQTFCLLFMQTNCRFAECWVREIDRVHLIFKSNQFTAALLYHWHKFPIYSATLSHVTFFFLLIGRVMSAAQWQEMCFIIANALLIARHCVYSQLLLSLTWSDYNGELGSIQCHTPTQCEAFEKFIN